MPPSALFTVDSFPLVYTTDKSGPVLQKYRLKIFIKLSHDLKYEVLSSPRQKKPVFILTLALIVSRFTIKVQTVPSKVELPFQ